MTSSPPTAPHAPGSGCAHHHHHGGHGDGRGSQRRLAGALVLAVVYMVAELVGGIVANSLALIADAGHMLSDAASLGLALLAIWIGRRPPSGRFSFGYRRAEVLAAFVNAAALLLVAVFICVEAYRRFRDPPPVHGGLMLTVAAGGLVVNLVMLRLLHAGRGESLNVEGAWLHVLTDLLGSVGAMLSGLLVWLLGWYWVDPIASVIIVVLVFSSGVSLLRRTGAVLMEATPDHIDVDVVCQHICGLDEVQSVHHLHVWTITGGEDALSAHVVIPVECDHDDLLARVNHLLAHDFGIGHATIQFEHQHCGKEEH